jgi:hypothetical protein
MTLYFFDFKLGDIFPVDEDGVELPNIESRSRCSCHHAQAAIKDTEIFRTNRQAGAVGVEVPHSSDRNF